MKLKMTCTNQIVSEDPSSDTDPEYLFDSEDEIIIEENLRKHKCRWRHVAPPSATVEFTGAEFSVPPDNFDSLSPHDIFSTFWSNEITQLIVEQTNLYSVLKNGQSVKTVIHEMEQFLGMQMMMGIFKLPSYKDYWATETRVNMIAKCNVQKTLQRFARNYSFCRQCIKRC